MNSAWRWTVWLVALPGVASLVYYSREPVDPLFAACMAALVLIMVAGVIYHITCVRIGRAVTLIDARGFTTDYVVRGRRLISQGRCSWRHVHSIAVTDLDGRCYVTYTGQPGQYGLFADMDPSDAGRVVDRMQVLRHAALDVGRTSAST